MADLVFEQKENLFATPEGPVTQFVEGVGQFGENIAEVTENLTQFFQVAKFFLQTLADPLAVALIPTIDALIAYLEDLKNIGAGTLAVWPWEAGNLPPQIDTSKLEQAIVGLAAAATGNEPKNIRYSPDSGLSLVQNKNGNTGIPTPDSISTSSRANFDKSSLIESLTSIIDFTHPESWKGTFDEGAAITLDYFNYYLNKRELTPQQVLDIIRESFDDTNDAKKPYGTGQYSAIVLMFAFPSFSDLKQIIQAFTDFFGGVLGDDFVKGMLETEKDDPTTIDLGDPVEIESKYFINDTKPRVLEDGTSKPRALEDGTYKYGNDIIPMFKEGDLLVQGGITYTNYSAKVIKHEDIVILNGIVVQNRVKVKEQRGKLKSTMFSNGKTTNVGVVRSAGNNYGDPSKIPAFAPQSSNKPEKKEIKKAFFRATITDGSNKLQLVVPATSNNKFVQRFIDNIGATGYVLRELLREKSFRDAMIDFVKSLSVGQMVKHPYLETFSVDHASNFQKLNQNSFGDAVYDFGTKSLNALAYSFPDFGINYHIKEILIDDKEFSNTNIENALFLKDEEGNYIEMRPISIVLGIRKPDGTYEENVLMKSAINVPGNVKHTFLDRNATNPTFKVYTMPNSKPPDWKFTRIQDWLPIYGDTIDEVINFLQDQKTWVNSKIEIIENTIKFFERLIGYIQELNEKIQSLVQLLSQGLQSAGLYTAIISGETGGVPDFKQKLNNAKFNVKDTQPFPEVSLEVVETTTFQTNPFTGLEEEIITKTTKPVVKEKDLVVTPGEPVLLAPSDLDSLKYSGAIVFYSQGLDAEIFKNYLNNLGFLQTLGTNLFESILGENTDLTDKIQPYVYDIQIQDSNENFVSYDSGLEARNDSIIRVIITNDAYKLEEFERERYIELQGRDIDFSPKILSTSIKVTKKGDGNILEDSVQLFRGPTIEEVIIDPLSNEPLKVYTIDYAASTENHFVDKPVTSIIQNEDTGQEFVNLDFKIDGSLLATFSNTDQYNVVVNKSILSYEKQFLKNTFVTKVGFNVVKATISDVEFN